ncbi:MAG: ABC transporter substrate-binding protein, partial [Acidimicrobiia bacterium]
MRPNKPIGLLLVLMLVAAACGDDEAEPTVTEAPIVTEAPTVTEAPPPVEGIPVGPGVDADNKVIRLGVLAALTGPIPAIGQSVLDGHRIYWDRVKRTGLLPDGWTVELVIEDNAYNPEQTVVVYNQIKDDVLAFSSTLGTPTTAAIAGPAADEDILLAASSLSSQWARTPNVILSLGSNTYVAQFANGPYWAMQVADPPIITADTAVGIIFQDDDYGGDCLVGYELALANLGFNDTLRQTYAATDTDFSAQMAAFQAGGVEVLFICATPTPLATMIGTNAVLGYDPIIFGSSPSYNIVLPFALGGGSVGDFEAEAAGLALFHNYYNLGTPAHFEDDFLG